MSPAPDPSTAPTPQEPPASVTSTRHVRARRRRTGLWVTLAVVVLVLAAVAASLLTVKQALSARDELDAALTDVPTVEAALRGGDADAARAALARVQEHTRAARHATQGPTWAVAGVVPGISTDVSAFRTATRSIDDLAQGVLPPLVDAAATVDVSGLGITDGRVDLGPLEQAAPLVQSASDRLAPVVAALDGLHPSDLRSQLAGPVSQLQDKVADLDRTVTTVHRTTALLPGMLGADGTRHYLLLSLNNAELRSQGGIPGSIVELVAKDGRVQIARSASAADLGPWSDPVLTLPKGDTDVFGDHPARFPQDTTMVPDFPTTARLAAAMWSRAGFGTVDGVVATDPVALAHVLGATGGVDVAGTHLDSDDVVRVLLSDVYREIPVPAEQDLFFAGAAQAVMQRLTGAGTDPSRLQEALVAASDERRLLVWSAKPHEEALLAGTQLAGDLTTSDRGRAALGVFLNDGTAGKMDYYLRSSVTLRSSRCVGPVRVDTVDVTLRSAAPADAATSLPEYVTGEISKVVPPGTIRTNLALYTPVGVGLPELTVDGKAVSGDAYTAFDRTQTQLTRDLRPGERVTVRVRMTTSGAAADDPSLEVWSTPTTTSGGLSSLSVTRCG